MALGGGTFTAQNKVLPGTYINFVSAASANTNLSDRGVATMPLELDWGVEGKVFEVTNEDFQKNSMKIFGYAFDDPKMKGLSDLFLGTQTLYAYRLNGDLYILHDDGGKLNLSFIGDMYVPIVIDAETGQNYDYESSIDSDTYNRIKLVFDNEKTGKRDVYIAQDSSHMNDWGILQYFDTLQDGENGQAKADALLKLYNKATKTLTIKDACGDSRVRGGSLVVVQLNLGDVQIKNLMLVEKCVHKYGESKHTMDLTLSGGGFSA